MALRFRLPALLVLGSAAFAAPTPPLQPFAIDHRSEGPASLDLSFLLDAPAGKDGPIHTEGGHFVKPDGKRIRFWGVDITDFARDSIHFPKKDDAKFWAGVLARLGINCVRLHNFDVPAPKGIIAPNRDDTRELDPEELDRMDYFVAALKERGIYVDLNLNVGRSFKAGDRVRDYKLMGYSKSVTYFDPKILELEREYARKLLTHFNPYTKSEYRNEPAVAFIEILNENSLVGAWIHGRLRGTKTSGGPANWQDVPPYYAQELTGMYNAWLERTHSPEELAALRSAAHVEAGQPVPRMGPDEFERSPRSRFDTEAGFYMDIEAGFFRDMKAFLRETVGTQALLLGTSDFSYGKSDYASLDARTSLDIIDGHAPWEGGAIVDEPLNSIIARLARTPIAGKPFTVSEHNHRFPSDYECESIPILAAYGSFQDWDGIFLYTFEMKSPGYKPLVETRADLSHDPVKLANLAAGALLFLRGDVEPARETAERAYSKSQVIGSLLLPPSAAGVTFTPGYSPAEALLHETRITALEGAPSLPPKFAPANPMVSDTGQLSWYYPMKAASATAEDDQQFSSKTGAGAHTGVVTVDSPRTQALIGFLPARQASVSHLASEITNPFASLVLTSLDGRPIERSSKLLLAATARVLNTGSEWDEKHTGLDEWGTTPTVIEPVTGRITLKGLMNAHSVTVIPLDGAQVPVGPGEAAVQEGSSWQIPLGKVATLYEVRVNRD